jgi:L-alanine-DL-glutamate epimerase-like enolase superfamily enzyme
MELTVTPRTVHTRVPFIIARGGSSAYPTVTIRLRGADGVEGIGEAAPSRFYGETAETVVAACERYRPVLEAADGWSLEAVEAELPRVLRFNAAARAGISAALHDLHAKRLGVPLWRLWGLDPSAAPRSSYTIAIAPSDEVLDTRVREAVAAGYPILKVKLGSPRDREILRVVRAAAPEAILRVDANAGWSVKQALGMLDTLVEHGVEFLEQPLPPHDIEGLRFVRDRAPMPVVADESCLVATDIPRLVGAVDGINIKLAKCGGLREALRMVAVARAHGLRVMCGCMVESSLGITAAAHFAALLDDADLDGAALLADDPYVGATIEGGKVRLPEGAGLGVTPR